MKTMTMIAGLVFLLGAEAQADLTCVNDPGIGQAKVELKVEEGGYTVSMYGHSRNTYQATYQNQAPFPRPIFQQKLVKVEDHSTWQDMPDALTLSYFEVSHTDIGFTYVLHGLLPAAGVEFNEFKHCVSNDAQL